ncbi:MAG: ABC transporter substrate-binding protein [Methyloligellaceae bacterium]
MFLALTIALLLAAPVQAQAAPDRAASFVQRISKELIAAARAGSVPAMTRAIRSYADVPSIGVYSLGDYAKRLKRSRRSLYYSGMTRFMARYVMSQFRTYQVVRADVTGPSYRSSEGIMVDSLVTVRNGSNYRVRWWLVRRGRSYKVRDAKVLFFWILPYQRDLFVNYIQDKGGSVSALVSALGG